MTRALAMFSLFAVCVAHPALAANEHHRHAPDMKKVIASTTPSAKDIFDQALRYENGEGVEQSYGHALVLYCEAAALDFPEAYFNLGWMFLNGRGVPQSDAVAAAWLRKAAKKGILQATNLLAMLQETSSSVPTACPSENANGAQMFVPKEVRELVIDAAQKAGLAPQLIMAVIAVESGFNPRAISAKNAQGLMQLLPETAVRFGVRDPFDEKENVRGGVTYLHVLLDLFRGDLRLALAAYNAGELAVLDHGGIPPYAETKNYVDRVTRICGCGPIVDSRDDLRPSLRYPAGLDSPPSEHRRSVRIDR